MSRSLLAGLALLLAGCVAPQLVSPYDETIDRGIVAFYEDFNVFIKDLGDLAGRPEGTYEANARKYNALETKLDVLILRASSASEGKGCRMESRLYEKVTRILGSEMPAELRAAAQRPEGDLEGCNTRLLELVKAQLNDIRHIHAELDKCRGEAGRELSCLRKATSQTALKIANQSINAVAVVEAAKRN